MSSEEGEPGSEQQQADAHEAPSGPTIATFASEWLGYAEVNIANDVRWYSNFPYLCLALLAAVVGLAGGSVLCVGAEKSSCCSRGGIGSRLVQDSC
jgi:hypothetical protein